MFTFVANPPNLANRCDHSYVKVAGSKLPDLPFVKVAGISDECLPIYVLEGIYGRVLVLDPSLHGAAFGTVNLRPSVFLAVETALSATAFNWALTTIFGFIRRLGMVVAQLPRIDVTDETVINTANHPDGRPVNRKWRDGYKLETLTDTSQRMSVFANLALLTGSRTSSSSRELAPPASDGVSGVNQWTAAHEALLPLAAAATGMPAPVVADRSVDPVPSYGADENADRLRSIAHYLRVCALPPELTDLPRDASDVRAYVRLMHAYADPSLRKSVLERNADKLISSTQTSRSSTTATKLHMMFPKLARGRVDFARD